MLTDILFKTQSRLLSTTSREHQPDADLQTVQNQVHALVSKSSKSLPDAHLQSVTKPRVCSISSKQKKASWMLTYSLFKFQSMLLSAVSRKGQLYADLQPVQNPEHALVSNKQEGPARC